MTYQLPPGPLELFAFPPAPIENIPVIVETPPVVAPVENVTTVTVQTPPNEANLQLPRTTNEQETVQLLTEMEVS